jgi:hypothetical protein
LIDINDKFKPTAILETNLPANLPLFPNNIILRGDGTANTKITFSDYALLCKIAGYDLPSWIFMGTGFAGHGLTSGIHNGLTGIICEVITSNNTGFFNVAGSYFAFYYDASNILCASGLTIDGLDISEYITAWKLVTASVPARKQNVKSSYCRATIAGTGNVQINLDSLGTGLGTAIYGIKPVIVASYEDNVTPTIPLSIFIDASIKFATIQGDANKNIMVSIIGEVA